MSYLFRFLRFIGVIVLVFYLYHYWVTVNSGQALLTLSVPPRAATETFRLDNVTDQPLWLDIADPAAGAQAGYASAIAPHHYSIFSLANGPVSFVCYQGALGVTTQKINCGRALKVGKVLSPPASAAAGNYWVLENIDETAH